ncbi:MAG TPA: alpha/beta fold hydrolase [Amycolatopsis sp.]|nr:alpha/beta fold hydrolase [Amycolatopsis sp.]
MTTFVLVHPAWFGGWCWRKVAAGLRSHGHDVHTPTLTGLAERAHLARPETGLATHVEDVAGVVTFEQLTDVVLVGSSSGGSVITGVAGAVPGRVAALVYLDAFVPSDGQCTRDLLPPERQAALDTLVATEGDGWFLPRFAPPPWPVIVRDSWQIHEDAEWVLPRLRPTPWRHFTEPVHAPESALGTISRWYVRCLRNPGPFDRFAEAAQANPGWQHRELDAPHLPFVTDPKAVVDVLLEAAVH